MTDHSRPIPDPLLDPLLDGAAAADLTAACGSAWRAVSDRVMGGVSQGTVRKETLAGRRCVRLQGEVSLENNGGFLQMTLDLAPHGGPVDIGAWRGLELTARGNGHVYNVHLKTADLQRPWQSYRHGFTAGPDWRTVRLPFAEFAPHRTDAPLDLRRVKRLGVVAIGAAFAADVALADLRLYA